MINRYCHLKSAFENVWKENIAPSIFVKRVDVLGLSKYALSCLTI